MSQINITREHGLGRKKVSEILDSMAEGLASQYGATYEKIGDKIKFKGPGVEGFFENLDDGVRIVADLGFFMRPFKSTFEKQIHETLDRLIEENTVQNSEKSEKKVKLSDKNKKIESEDAGPAKKPRDKGKK